MEKITLTVPASRALSGRALAGVVGSGDMEVLFNAEPGQTLTIDNHLRRQQPGSLGGTVQPPANGQ